jgi:hypothetical protein
MVAASLADAATVAGLGDTGSDSLDGTAPNVRASPGGQISARTQPKETSMYARVATFEDGDGAKAAAEIRARNEAEGGPPPGLPAKKLLILSGEGGKSLAITFFETEEDYRQGDETLNSMSPPSGDNDMGQRAGVEKFEVVLELES